MKWIQLAFLVSFVIAAEAAIAHEPFNPNIKHSGHCFTTSFNIGAMKEGEVRHPKGHCAEVKCGTGNNRDISYFSCGVVGVPPGCRLSDIDLTKTYPDCCKRQPIC